MIEVCVRINNAKRHIVRKRIDNGNEPLYSLGYMDLSKQYSTIGVNGLNECLELMELNILEESGQEFALKIMDTINSLNKKYEKQYDSPHNTEQVPGESMSVKMAEKDRLLGYQNRYNIYSNQFIPLVTNADMLDRIRIQGILDKHFSGGAICHINVDTQIRDVDQIKELIRTTAKMGVVYHAINYNLQECKNGHMSVGRKEVCAICGEEITNNYTRVVGFLTNTKNWHKVRRDEDYPNRQFYEDIQQ
jgi:ribonucleoside-triphosphate reductase